MKSLTTAGLPQSDTRSTPPLWSSPRSQTGTSSADAISADATPAVRARLENALIEICRQKPRAPQAARRAPVAHAEHNVVLARGKIHLVIPRDVARSVPRAAPRAGFRKLATVHEQLEIIRHRLAAQDSPP